jgi:hypothetical protein
MLDEDEQGQTMLLDTSTKQYNPFWVDAKQKGIIPNNPLHYKAHKLQVLLARLDKQAESNPAQFNSKNYIDALKEWTHTVKLIKDGKTEDEAPTTDDAGGMGAAPGREAAAVGTRAPAGVGSGISSDNPFSG